MMLIRPLYLIGNQKFENTRWQMVAILKIEKRDISQTVWPICTKFAW